MTERPAPGRVGRRQRQAVTEAASALPIPAYRRLSNPFAPITLLSDDQVEAIHESALHILQEIGLRVLLPEARTLLDRAGAAVNESSHMVRFGRDLIGRHLATAPRRIDLLGGSPGRTVEIGGRNLAVAAVGGPPNVSDIERGRRPGTLADFRDFVRLSQTFDVVHLLGPSVEPLEVAPAERHLQITHSQLTLSNKPPFVYARGSPQVADCFAMIRLARGLDQETFAATPCCFAVINTNSPLQLDKPMSQGIIDFARAGQLTIVTPFTLAGAMAPISLAGALVQQHAEAIAGIVLSQVVRPGAPVLYGGFTSNVDMRSGAPAFGTPEFVKAAWASGQLARRIGLPWRSSNVNASNAPDAQSAYESEMSLWGAIMAGCNVLAHGAGWLEGGLTASFEKFIIDVEMLQMFAELFRPLPFSPAELARETIAAVGPGGHHFGTEHTLERYRTAFYEPLLSDWSNYGRWTERGSLDATRRANLIYKETLRTFEPPSMDPAARERIDAYRDQRAGQGGALPES